MAARKDYARKQASANTTGPQDPQAQSQPAPDLTVNGKPIPVHLRHAINYAITDQGIAEEIANRKARGTATPGISVVMSEWDKKLQAFADDKSVGNEPWQASDPVEAAKSLVPDASGKAFHLFSEAVYNHSGPRGFVPERDAAGHLIKVGNMVVASMPADKAAEREQHYMDLAREAQKAEIERFRSSQEESRASGITPLAPGDSIGGLQQSVAMPGNSAEAVEIGHSRQVGNAGAILAGV